MDCACRAAHVDIPFFDSCKVIQPCQYSDQDQITEFLTVKPGGPECVSVYHPRLQTLQEKLPAVGHHRHCLSITEQMCDFCILVLTVPRAESA